ncbi:MAG: hypothetical protein QJR09_08340 [Micrococcus sp.]|nr:hypothetical protein [Micrococcus sp.]
MDTNEDRPREQGSGSVPYLPPRPSGDAPPPRPRRGWWVALGVVVVLALAVFVVWPLVSSQLTPRAGDAGTPQPSVSRNTDPGLDGIVARDVPPGQFQPGDCLTDFTAVQEPATVVECSREHEAQLVGRKLWPEAGAFPGDRMRPKAEEFCGTIQLGNTGDAQVIVEISHPTEGTWATGDRRVDCVAVAHDGTLTSSLVEEPVFQDYSTLGAPAASASPSGAPSES